MDWDDFRMGFRYLIVIDYIWNHGISWDFMGFMPSGSEKTI